MYSVYQHWDPLKVCIVGRSYPPEFYDWIAVPHVRSLFEKIAIETEEDYQNIIKKLQEFGVEILRPDLPTNTFVNGKYVPAPMAPRDHMVMIGDTFYTAYGDANEQIKISYNHDMDVYKFNPYDKIVNFIKKQGNSIKSNKKTGCSIISGATVARIGKDLYFGTDNYNQNQLRYKSAIELEFTNTRNHIVNTGGHGDGTYCPVTPGLIISLHDVPTYADTFPDWEVVYLPGQSWDAVQPFLDLKKKNLGKWWIPGFEYDQHVVDVVETWLSHWTGYVEETVFDVNMLIINPKNVMVFNYNKLVFDALERYGITPHVVPFRHRYFWDGGIHCVTSDLHREGTMQDYFLQKG